MSKNAHKDALTNACISFGETLKAFIKDPNSGRAAHVAAQCLFEVRKLENAIAEEGGGTRLARGTGVGIAAGGPESALAPKALAPVSHPAGEKRSVIPPVCREDLP